MYFLYFELWQQRISNLTICINLIITEHYHFIQKYFVCYLWRSWIESELYVELNIQTGVTISLVNWCSYFNKNCKIVFCINILLWLLVVHTLIALSFLWIFSSILLSKCWSCSTSYNRRPENAFIQMTSGDISNLPSSLSDLDLD